MIIPPAEEPWKLGFTADKAKYRFQHAGHKFTLFRRAGSPNWYCKKKAKGKQHMFAARTTEVKSAVMVISQLYDDLVSGKIAARKAEQERLREMATVGQIIDTYVGKVRVKKRIKAETVADNASALRRIIREGSGMAVDAPVDGLRSDVLTRELVKRFQERRRELVMDEDEIQQGRANRSMDSVLTAARSLFTPHAMECYADAKLLLPPLEGFLQARRMKGYNDVRYVPIGDEVIEAMDTAMKEMRTSRPSLYLAYQLMLMLGLRNGEVAAAKRTWIERRRVYVVEGETVTAREIPMMAVLIRPDFIPKHRTERCIPIPETLMRDIEELVPATAIYLIDAPTETLRREVADRELCEFVAGYLPDRQKKAYELRKHFGSIVAATQGKYKAQEYLGHKSITTTEANYASFLSSRNSRPMQMSELLPNVVQVREVA
jgi:integrase